MQIISTRQDQSIILVKDDIEIIPWMKDTYPAEIGYSNHGPIENCIEAVKRGAVIIEQHFTLSRDTIDGQFAAMPEEFERMVKEVRECSSKARM